jgi:hypothetical protein
VGPQSSQEVLQVCSRAGFVAENGPRIKRQQKTFAPVQELELKNRADKIDFLCIVVLSRTAPVDLIRNMNAPLGYALLPRPMCFSAPHARRSEGAGFAIVKIFCRFRSKASHRRSRLLGAARVDRTSVALSPPSINFRPLYLEIGSCLTKLFLSPYTFQQNLVMEKKPS